MELTEVASNPENRERNNKIVPVMISRLRRLQQEAQEEREQQRTALKRPFKAFANSAACSIAAKRRYSREVQAESEGELRSFLHWCSLIACTFESPRTI